MFSHRSPLIATAVTAMALLAPALAHATNFCVNDAMCVQGGGTQEATFDDALAAAVSTGDQISLGAGTYTAATTAGFSSASPVAIVGAGEDQTSITGPTNTSPLLTLNSSNATVSNLSLVV